MSHEKINKADLAKSVASLSPADKEGWCTKQGGSYKSWKRRWLVLKDKRLWYFANKTSTTAKGYIVLDPSAIVKQEPGNKKFKFMFSIHSRGIKGERTFPISVESNQELQEWQAAIKKNLMGGVEATKSASETIPTTNPAPTVTPTPTPTPTPATPEPQPSQATTKSKYAKLDTLKDAVAFLKEPEKDNKVMEFWQMWTESIPTRDELEGQTIEFHVSASTDLEKLSWRTSGPQSVVIQKMVDFFWNVGAPEPEIDKLNEVGAAINPVKIGSWIDMSAKNGMDGGWYFPVDITPKLGIEAADAGESTKKLLEWCDAHSVAQCFTVGRDMGAAPPRQTEMRLRLPAQDFAGALSLALDAFSTFGFAPIPENILSTVKANPCETVTLSVITSTDGFVRLGIMLHKPSASLVQLLVEATGKKDRVDKLAAAAGQSPSVVELQHLRAGFGYGVYKEGFDVVLHWDINMD